MTRVMTLSLLVMLSGCGDDDGPGPSPDGGGRTDAPAVDAPGTDAPVTPDAGAGGVTLRDTRDSLAWVAGQDGEDGAWTVLTNSGGGIYRFEPSGDLYALAYVCELASGTNVVVVHASIAEVATLEAACIPPAAETLVDIGGSVSGLAGTDTATIAVASRQAMVGAGMMDYMLEVPMGTRDLFARRITSAPTFDRVVRMNDVMLADGADFDVDFTAGFAPETHAVTVMGAAAGETTGTLVIFRNPEGGSPHPLGSWSTPEFQTLPASELRPGDMHSIVVSANDAAAMTFRSVRHMMRAGSDVTATFHPLQPVPTIDAAGTTPYLRPRSTLATAGDPDNVTLVFTQRDDATMRSTVWTLTATRGWLAASGASTLEVPDHSALAGFMAEWGLDAGTMQWQHFQNWSSLGVADAFSLSQTTAELDGAEYGNTQHLGTITL
jgi:hypothetical protein